MQTVEIYADREYLGTTAQALCCPDTDTHRRRLRMAGALLRGVQINTLADIGCGFADLVEFLKSLTDDEALRDPRWSNPWVVGR